MRTIDLNADLGEGAGADAELLATVTSASVACGGHAGDEASMRATVRAAREKGVAVGAHPGYPDREGFGRRELGLSAEEVARTVMEQVVALLGICRSEDVPLRYVKAHGALYLRAVHDASVANAFVSAVVRTDPGLSVLAPAGSAILAAASAAGLTVAREAFLDRGYLADGSLAPRDAPGGVIADPEVAAERGVRLAREEAIHDLERAPLFIPADSLCVHGDSPVALRIARTVRERLLEAGVALAPFAP